MEINFKKILSAILLVAAAFCVGISAQKQMSDAKLSRELVGLWHIRPYVASGMNDLYRFHKNGRFEFEYSQMVWSKRMISYSGKWRIKNGHLILAVTKRIIIAGGKKVLSDQASGSADGYEIVGGKEVIQKLKTGKVHTYKLSRIRQGEMMRFVLIGKKMFWQLSDDSKSYPILCLRNALLGVPVSA